MLSRYRPHNGIGGNALVPHTARFAHLVDEAVPEHLAAATCIYFDGIVAQYRISELLDLVESWFSGFERKPRVVLVRTSEKKSPRCTFASLRSAATVDEAAFRRIYKTLQFFPKGRTTIDDTWRPSVYCAVSAERPASAFFCVNADLDASDLLPVLRQGEKLFRNCASYGFWFPERYSPLGYYWGIVVEPAGHKDGSWGKRESRRLSHWRDNTSIGIEGNKERRFFGACEGYVRDAFPLMLLDEKHMARKAGDMTLLERINKDNLGTLEPIGERRLWRIPPRELSVAQALLDDNDISLSFRRLESVRG